MISVLDIMPDSFHNILFITIYFNCKWVFNRWQWYYNKAQHTNNTTIKRNTEHKTIHTINTIHRMKIQQSQLNNIYGNVKIIFAHSVYRSRGMNVLFS
jgi:hypothetical protein